MINPILQSGRVEPGMVYSKEKPSTKSVAPTTAGPPGGIKKRARISTPNIDWITKYTELRGKEVKCNRPTCLRTLSNIDHFKRHYFNQHLGKRYRCEVCQMNGKCKKTYAKHIPACHGDTSKQPLVVFTLEDGTEMVCRMTYM